MSLPTVRERRSSLCVAVWSNVCVSVVRDRLAVDDVAAARRVYERAAEEERFVSLIIADKNASMPSEEARRAIPELMKGIEHRVAVMVGVLEATGFKAAALRTSMATMALISKSAYPRKIVGTIDEAIGIVIPHVRPKTSEDVLREAITMIRGMSE